MRVAWVDRGAWDPPEEPQEVFIWDSTEREIYVLVANTEFLGYPVLLCATEETGLVLITHDRIEKDCFLLT